MTKKQQGTFIILSIVVLATATVFLYKDSRKRYAKTIIANNASQQPLAWLASLEAGYLKAWARALTAGEKQFVYNGKKYDSQGGKAIQ